MYDHLFNTYEATTPPEDYFLEYNFDQPTTEEQDLIIQPSSQFYNNVSKPIDNFGTKQPETNYEQEFDNVEKEDIKYEEKASSKKSSIKFKSKEEFVKTLNQGYRKALQKRGIDPNFSYILVAQAAMESGWGQHQAGRFNFGGIKAVGNQKGSYKKTKEYDSKKGYYTITDKFRDFDSIEDYCDARIKLLSNKRYNLFNQFNPDDSSAIITHLLKKGYGTAPIKDYVPSVMKIYNTVINILNK